MRDNYVKFLKAFSVLCVSALLLSGYTFPVKKDTYFIQGSGTLGTNVTVYIPYNQNYRFSVDKESKKIINVSSVSVTGYLSDRTITFPQFDTPYYRNGTQTVTISWNEITDYNLPMFDSPDIKIGTTIVVIGFLIFMILCLKR